MLVKNAKDGKVINVNTQVARNLIKNGIYVEHQLEQVEVMSENEEEITEVIETIAPKQKKKAKK